MKQLIFFHVLGHRTRRNPAVIVALLGILGISFQTRAADDPAQTDAAAAPSAQSAPVSRWTLDFESSYVFHNIQNPWFLLAGYRGAANRKNLFDYHINSYVFGVRYDLTHIGGWRFLRGYWQGSLGALYSDILQGPETYYAGAVVGMRYIFVPGEGTWSPYVEFRGGAGATDASHVFYGQQDDLAFTYLFGAGLRYQPSPRWRFSIGVVDQHISDFYLTNPNYGFDSAGFIAAVEWRR